MKVILPYNILVLCAGDFFVEGLKAGDVVRGYYYNEKKYVTFPLLSVTKVGEVPIVNLVAKDLKPITLSDRTKVLTMGGPTECYKAIFLMSICQTNPKQVNIHTITSRLETKETVECYELEWEGQNNFLWAEGILVGS